MLGKIKEYVKGIDHNKAGEKFFTVCRWFNIQLTTAFGILTTVHWSVPAFGLLLLLMSGQEAAWFYFVGMLSVVPHAYGHAVAGMQYGIKTRRILLYPIGGVAMMEGMGKKWYHETVIALAGPAVSLVLALIGLLGMWIEGPTKLMMYQGDLITTFDYRSIWVSLFLINAILVIFNLIPAFPMDGGRVLRSVLERFVGKLRATKISFYVSCVLCGLMIFAGLLMGSMSLMLVALLIIFMARQEHLMVQLKGDEPEEDDDDEEEGDEKK